MSLWEYKVLSGKQTPLPSLPVLESFLNALGRDQWEIVSWSHPPGSPLEFTALARRPTYKEWYLEGPPPQKPVEPPKATGAGGEYREPVLPAGAIAEDDEAIWSEEGEEEDDSPQNIFEAVRPFLKRSGGSLLAASLEFLAGKFGVETNELLGAFAEEGLKMGEGNRSEMADHDGLSWWLNSNNRGQVWINARPKATSRLDGPPLAAPVAAAVPAAAPAPLAAMESPAAESGGESEVSRGPGDEMPMTSGVTGVVPTAQNLLELIRPYMRRNRRGPGYSGSVDYLARALQVDPMVLLDLFGQLGLATPATSNDRMEGIPLGGRVYWLNRSGNGQIWINAKEGRPGYGGPVESGFGGAVAPGAPQQEVPERSFAGAEERSEAADDAEERGAAPEAVAPEPAEESPVEADNGEAAEAAEAVAEEPSAAVANPWLADLRQRLQKPKRGKTLGRPLIELADEARTDLLSLVERLVGAGLPLPEDDVGDGAEREIDGWIHWIARDADGRLTLHAKEKPRRATRARSRSASARRTEGEPEAAPEGAVRPPAVDEATGAPAEGSA